MTTKCNTEQLAFHGLGRREVVGCFNGGEISSDGGGLLLREVEQRTQILRRLSQCFIDHRHPARIEHSVESLLAPGARQQRQTLVTTIPGVLTIARVGAMANNDLG